MAVHDGTFNYFTKIKAQYIEYRKLFYICDHVLDYNVNQVQNIIKCIKKKKIVKTYYS